MYKVRSSVVLSFNTGVFTTMSLISSLDSKNVEEGIKMVISGGIVTPKHKKIKTKKA